MDEHEPCAAMSSEVEHKTATVSVRCTVIYGVLTVASRSSSLSFGAAVSRRLISRGQKWWFGMSSYLGGWSQLVTRQTNGQRFSLHWVQPMFHPWELKEWKFIDWGLNRRLSLYPNCAQRNASFDAAIRIDWEKLPTKYWLRSAIAEHVFHIKIRLCISALMGRHFQFYLWTLNNVKPIRNGREEKERTQSPADSCHRMNRYYCSYRARAARISLSAYYLMSQFVDWIN